MRAAWIVVLLAMLAACERASSNRGTEATPTDAVPGRGATGIRFLASGDGAGFARAIVAREFSFPTDHGAHDEFRTEWWYFTGNLDDVAGSHFGFELTFFRVALTPQARAGDSAWGANQVWMAHFVVTDVTGRRFVTAERFARGSLGLAGADAAPFRVWVKEWSVEGGVDTSDAKLVVSARDGETALALRLSALKPAVAQGNRGLDAKGPEPGNASYYYSFPRLAAIGSIEIDGVRHEVHGNAWMDREWGTSTLSADVVGWDWFALQLSDGRELMYYRLRQGDGRASPFSGGSIVGIDGRSQRLTAEDVQLEALDYWRSERTGVRYPLGWRMDVPSERLTLDIEPYLQEQEVDLSVRYWEGAVRTEGNAGGSRVTGQGYLELAGY